MTGRAMRLRHVRCRPNVLDDHQPELAVGEVLELPLADREVVQHGTRGRGRSLAVLGLVAASLRDDRPRRRWRGGAPGHIAMVGAFPGVWSSPHTGARSTSPEGLRSKRSSRAGTNVSVVSASRHVASTLSLAHCAELAYSLAWTRAPTMSASNAFLLQFGVHLPSTNVQTPSVGSIRLVTGTVPSPSFVMSCRVAFVGAGSAAAVRLTIATTRSIEIRISGS